ncbi:MAG: HAD hydrolase-like protein [Xanthomonadales bacterium]|nr:HAD hydrolase-like protein [Gammaproteobacteria bacterium]MBT8054262.1 HAD hydrolase-like protein [Gammaproteobacteria bacterium]NND57545.1 HAD hydrolase-like protein [Xanthomonadales bacterium]NNK51269.1 HAD hydrolase-like protein [Xanthomonadales bacterium]
MNNVRNVLFDLDGTLVDSSRTISTCIEYALQQTGAVPDREVQVRTLIGKPLLDIFRDVFSLTPAQTASAIGHYREHYDDLAQAGTEVYDSVHEMLSHLGQGGYRLFIATVKPTPIAGKVLADLQLRNHFEGIAGASMGPERRDKTRIIAHALRKFDLDPSQSLMIGDRDQDILGARANRMSAIAVTYGFGSRNELISARPDHLVGHSKDIAPLLMNRMRAE